MLSITQLYPRPKAVTLGGRTFLVGEMRLADLVALQGWLDGRWESPLEPLRPLLDAMDGPGRLAALRGIWDACEAGPPAWGKPEATELLRTGAGIVETFRVILGTHHPELTAADVLAVAESTSPAEYAAMLGAWRRTEPIDEVAWMLGMDEGSDRGSPIGWPQVVCELCEAYGWTLDHVLTLTLGQIRVARSGGKPRDRGIRVAPKTNLSERLRAMKARMFGEKGGSDGG